MARAGEIDLKDFLNQQKQKKKAPLIRQDVDYITPKEYAEIVRAHPNTVNIWLNKGIIEGAFKVGRHWKIPVIPKEAKTAVV